MTAPGRITQAVRHILSDVSLFSRLVLKLPLYRYQVQAVTAVIDSVLNRRGLEFLLVFPRQSGKNEAVAQLLVYLLNLLQRAGGNIVYGAIGDGLGRGIDRLEERLDNDWNGRHWTKKTKPTRRLLGKAAVIFLSSHPQASARGETAHWLLVIDEMQDQHAPHLLAVFDPMRAASNATAVYLGTVKTTGDALWQKKQELEKETEQDGLRRVFLVTPDQVTAENRYYAQFLNAKIRRYGRKHPIIASEYFLEPIDAEGGLFPPARCALMRGPHARLRKPEPGKTYVATLDVAGQDEAATDPVARLHNPGRDYTVATVFEVMEGEHDDPGPAYLAVDVFVDHGSRHFQNVPGRPMLAARLLAFLETWGVVHLVSDQSGVGEGLTSWLQAKLGRRTVTGFSFAGRSQKAALGSSFLALIETGRFKYWSSDEDTPLSDGWWFWAQASACDYELPPDGRFDRDLRWGVPATKKLPTPEGTQPIHDDRLLSAALIAHVDTLIRSGTIVLGRAESAVIPAQDPLQDMEF